MHAHRRLRATLAILIPLTLATLMMPIAVSAHADLTASEPANGATVTGPLAGPVVLTYSEALKAGSHAELLDPAGTKVADAAVDAANPAKMTFTLASPLQPGKYTVQWTSVAADKDVARGQVTFTVVAPTPAPATPTPAPTATAAPTAAATAAPTATAATAAPSPTAAPAAMASPTPAAGPASASDAIIPIVAAFALVALVAVVLLRRGRAA